MLKILFKAHSLNVNESLECHIVRKNCVTGAEKKHS